MLNTRTCAVNKSNPNENRKFAGFPLYGVTFGTLAFTSLAFLK